jgi:hypothetical protein
MPTPSTGPISFSDIVAEFGNLGGSPASIGEYTGRAGSDPSLTFGIEGINNSGPINLSQVRGKTAHASAKKIINALKNSFGATPYYNRTNYWCEGNSVFYRFPFLSSNPGIYNGTCGGANNGNLVDDDIDMRLTNINQTADNVDEDLKETYGATLIFMGYGNARVNTTTARMSGFNAIINGISTDITSYGVYTNDPGTNHGGSNIGGSFHAQTLKSATRVFHIPSNIKFKSLTAASWDKVYVWWNGNDGSSQSDSITGGIVFALPSRWIRTSYTLYGTNQGTMTLGPYEIGIVVNGNGGTATVAPPRILNKTSGDSGAPSTITPLYFEQLIYGSPSGGGSKITLGIYGNETNTTATYDLANASYRPLVQIFKFVGDGYASAVLQNI